MGLFDFIFGKRKPVSPSAGSAESAAVQALHEALEKLKEKNKQTNEKIAFLKEQEKLASKLADEAGARADEAYKDVKYWEGVQTDIKRVEDERKKNKLIADQKIKESSGSLKELIRKYEGGFSRDLRLLLDPAKSLAVDESEAIRLVLMSREEPPFPIDPRAEAIENSLKPAVTNQLEKFFEDTISSGKLPDLVELFQVFQSNKVYGSMVLPRDTQQIGQKFNFLSLEMIRSDYGMIRTPLRRHTRQLPQKIRMC